MVALPFAFTFSSLRCCGVHIFHCSIILLYCVILWSLSYKQIKQIIFKLPSYQEKYQNKSLFLFPLCYFPLKGMASKSSKTLFSLLIIHLFALSQCKSPFKISRMSHVARSTKFRGDIHKGKCRCKLFFLFFFSYYTFYNGHVCLIPKIPNLITCLRNPTFFTLMASGYANLWEKKNMFT